jgi:hypothetical protein
MCLKESYSKVQMDLIHLDYYSTGTAQWKQLLAADWKVRESYPKSRQIFRNDYTGTVVHTTSCSRCVWYFLG